MKKYIWTLLLVCTFFLCSKPVSASPFEIHAIYLKGCSAGDAILVKSNEEFILMDTGKASTSKQVIAYLRKQKVKKLSVYISHVDEDHVGGLNAIAAKFKITTLYMPDRTIASNAALRKVKGKWWRASNEYARIRSVARKEKSRLVELKRGSSFTIGDATFDVVGPIKTVSNAEYKKIADLRTDDDAYGKSIEKFMKSLGPSYYLNGMSLSTMISCNQVKYLTMGDTVSEMEAHIARLYDLDADILKMPHHACNNATSATLLKAVTPTFVFGSAGNKQSYARTARAEKRVLTYAQTEPLITGHLKKNIVYKVSDEGLIKVKLK